MYLNFCEFSILIFTIFIVSMHCQPQLQTQPKQVPQPPPNQPLPPVNQPSPPASSRAPNLLQTLNVAQSNQGTARPAPPMPTMQVLPTRGPPTQIPGQSYQTSQALACKCFEPIDCLAVYECGQRKDGVYKIYPKGSAGFDVYCDQGTDGGGWTLFQRRYEGKVDFYRGWRDYQFGFGNINGEHWLGNQRLHEMTSQGSHELRIDMQDWNGNWRYAKYRIFSIDSVNKRYRLNIDAYIGNAGDSLSLHDGKGFYTKDADSKLRCAQKYKGAWWYHNCHYSNLNGQYLRGNHSRATFGQGIEWYHWTGFEYSLKITVLKFRRR